MDIEQALANARTKLLIRAPFYATLLMSTPVVLDRGIPTACTDGLTIWINPDFFMSLDEKYHTFVLGHEVGHICQMHCLRIAGRDEDRWGRATDYSWNLMMKDAKDKSGKPSFEIWPKALCDEKYREEPNGDGTAFAMSADKIYDLLEKEDQQQKKSGSGSQSDGTPGEGKCAHGCQIKAPDIMTDPDKVEQVKRSIERRVAQAATAARMMGTLDGNLERFVNEILNPKVPWYETLRHLMTECDRDDEDWQRRNRRFSEVYLPTDWSEMRMGELVAIGDSSGSCYDDIPNFFAEFLGIAEDCKPEQIRLVWADTSVKGEQVFERGDEIDVKPKGFGGTDMRVPLEYVEQYDPKVVVLFTDGHTPWPDAPPPYPLIVCCTTNVGVPVGEVVRI